MRKIAILIIFSMMVACQPQKSSKSEHKFDETWESLADHNEEPEWFKDAKFGIYFHWGVYSVPAFGNEWYPRWMHFEGDDVHIHHTQKYGSPSEFGYHDFVPMFKAENFDAEEWAVLFKKAGARFAGPVAEHHDGFSMWDSDQTPWNAADKGPKRDITGELEKAVRNQGMKFITTFHHARHLQRYKGKENQEMQKENKYRKFANSHYPLFPGMPPAADNSKLNYLYGNIPEAKWLEEIWFGKLKEVIDNYSPDIVWFDSWLDQIPENYRKKFCAYYLNGAEKKEQDVVIVRKQDDLPLDVSVDDLEKSRKNKMGEKCWMTDETVSMGSWCYTKDLKIKPSTDVLHTLIDIVSKNGVLLLNLSPKADGTIPEDQKAVLLDLGQWLKKNGDAIYKTRPWHTFGEGPTKEPEGHFKNHEEFLKIKYTTKDIRYTRSKDGKTIYACILGVPKEAQKINLSAFANKNQEQQVTARNIKVLGGDNNLEWAQDENGIEITCPTFDRDEMAIVFQIML